MTIKGNATRSKLRMQAQTLRNLIDILQRRLDECTPEEREQAINKIAEVKAALRRFKELNHGPSR